MSLYNMIHGVKPATFWILPMLGTGHHPDTFPRFRDCFLGDPEHPEHDNKIIVYTRTGGGNRDDYEAENDWMRGLPGFITDYDDSFDCTFACWVFEVPAEWKPDFYLIVEGKLKEVSPAYRERLYQVFPKLKEKFDELFAVEAPG